MRILRREVLGIILAALLILAFTLARYGAQVPWSAR